MPVVGWIDALRQYNAGMPSWCIPRKGTPGYDLVMRIRQGEKPKTFKELTAELERKTGGKPKGEKTSMKIDLGESKEVVSVPTIPTEAAKTDRKESTEKMSQQKTMAVIQPTHVAEGGSAKNLRAKRNETSYRRQREEHRRDKLQDDIYRIEKRVKTQKRELTEEEMSQLKDLRKQRDIHATEMERLRKEVDAMDKELLDMKAPSDLDKKIVALEKKRTQMKRSHETQSKSLAQKTAELKPIVDELKALREERKKAKKA